MNLLFANPARHLLWQEGTPDEIAHVASHFHNQSRMAHYDMSRPSILYALLKFLEIRSEQVLQIGRPRAMPRYGKNLARIRSELLYDYALRRAEFVDGIPRFPRNAKARAKACLIGLHGGNVTSQLAERSRRAEEDQADGQNPKMLRDR